MSKVNKLYLGNCLDVLPTIESNSVDSIVTDAPYELGFMGKSWDNSGIAYSVPMWKECLRVLKPGGHLLSFSGTRTYHRMAVAIEDAGFEVRDMIEWVYSTGFPKSLNVYKQLEKKYGKQEAKYSLRLMPETNISQTINDEKKQREILLSELSEQSVSLSRNTTNNDGGEKSSVEGRYNIEANSRELSRCEICQMSERVSENGKERWLCYGTPFSDGETSKCDINKDRSCPSYRPQSSEQSDREFNAVSNEPSPQDIRRTRGVGTAMKPAHEPICLARKPLAEKTVAENVLKYGTGGINIDESRVGTEEITTNCKGIQNGNTPIVPQSPDFVGETHTGRFPANLIHDNSEEVRECFPETKSGAIKKGATVNADHKNTSMAGKLNSFSIDREVLADSGNASRFFKSILYYPKASKKDRNSGCEDLEDTKVKHGLHSKSFIGDKEYETNTITKNFHPTVKPIALMSYLIKMITRPGGIVLDPFSGSGSTLVAAKENGFQYVGIELTEEYLPIIQARTGCEIIHNTNNVIQESETEPISIVEEKPIVIQKPNNDIQVCSCGGRIVKYAKGRCCESCLTDY